jgi:hypothetical protein
MRSRHTTAVLCALGACAGSGSIPVASASAPQVTTAAAGSGGPGDFVPANNEATAASHGTEPIPAVPTVRFVYLIPSDRPVRYDYIDAIERGARRLQQWWGTAMGNGKTFRMRPQPVEFYRTAHDAAYYPGDGAPGFGFFNRVEQDAFALTGGHVNDPQNIWIIYVDAVNACGQVGGAGGAGRAIMERSDLEGLLSGAPYNRCGQFFAFPIERWIGGLGHELGHALNLPHPSDCDAGLPSCPCDTLMYAGYAVWPNTYLLPSDITTLNQSAFLRSDWPTVDTDGDTMPDDWEDHVGLDWRAADASGDPDADARTNLQEFQAGTHPRGLHRAYFAEGAANAFFDTRLALFNPTAEWSRVLVTYLQPQGGTVAEIRRLAPHRRSTVDPKRQATLTSPDFSFVIESDRPLIADRTMSWDASGYGSHAESAVPAPSATWYLAEGSTSGDFALFYLLQNPNPTPTNVTIRYLRPLGLPPIERARTLPPNSRTTIPVDNEGPELASTDVSASITASAPIIVERAMYISRPLQPFAAGHESAGVTAPAASWFLAEGATGPFFDLFILLANPGSAAAPVTVDYLLSTGETHTKTYTVAPESRLTIWADDEQIPAGSGIRPLANVAVSTTITSTNGVPIIVERAMWWPGPSLGPNFWTEAHNSPGATVTGARWALAEGEVGGPQGAETYILIANTSTAGGSARVTLRFEDGTSADRTFTLLPRSRTSVNVSAEFPVAAGRRFGAVIESLGPSPAQIVVERAMYTSPGGVIWTAGTNALASRLP